MGRAKEKILARNKIKSDKKMAKAEERELQRAEEARQAAELKLVKDQQQNATERDRERGLRKKKGNKNREPDEPATPVHHQPKSTNKAPHFSVNPNHGYVQKPYWKEQPQEKVRDFSVQPRAESETVLPRQRVIAELPEDLRTKSFEDIFRADEMKTLVDILNSHLIKSSTIAGIQLSELMPSVAAVILNRFDLIKQLVKGENDYSDKWVTPLGCAMILKKWDMIECLLENDKSADAVDKFGNTILLQAALSPAWESNEIVNLWHILQGDKGTHVDVGMPNKLGVTVTHALAWRGWHDVMDEILPINPSTEDEIERLSNLVNARMIDHTTPLMLATAQKHVATAQRLVILGGYAEDEDKFGASALCRAVSDMYVHKEEPVPTEIMQTVSPVCQVILNALNYPGCPVNVGIYAKSRLDLIMSMSTFDDQTYVDIFYRQGRAVFSFLVRYMQDGLGSLLQWRMFLVLSEAGKKRLDNPDFIVAICGIMFDVLVYAEDRTELWDWTCKAFVDDGAADFCLSLPYHYFGQTEKLELGTFACTGSGASASSLDGAGSTDWVRGCLGMAAPDIAVSVEKNVTVASIMPFIQVIDNVEMGPWFDSNFANVKLAYKLCETRGGPTTVFACDLDGEHVKRTRNKVRAFQLYTDLDLEVWTSPQELIERLVEKMLLESVEPEKE